MLFGLCVAQADLAGFYPSDEDPRWKFTKFAKQRKLLSLKFILAFIACE